jgi:hypothetical protein
MKTLDEKIAAVKIAPNMVEIESILQSVTSDYLNLYSQKIECAPNADNYGSQSKWIEKAVRFFIANIHADKKTIWQHIPQRFNNTAIYQRLKLSQFVK